MQLIGGFKGKSEISSENPASHSISSSTGMPGNIFPKGTLFVSKFEILMHLNLSKWFIKTSFCLKDMYVFISESEKFTEFNDETALLWFLNNIEYGDWTYGENKDGILTKKNEIILTEVN